MMDSVILELIAMELTNSGYYIIFWQFKMIYSKNIKENVILITKRNFSEDRVQGNQGASLWQYLEK